MPKWHSMVVYVGKREIEKKYKVAGGWINIFELDTEKYATFDA